ncbi:MAG: hypothetical protein BVN35_09650 [Proteobacteria bacterium ST_bin11]|nr:MAG: hypothetical protein BVN35_09650 [Proteobacteria bacterium ST_bin11]
MDLYHFHHVTGEYLGASIADPDPLIPGAFLVPAWTTPISLPTAEPNQVAVFNGVEWALFSDYRGTIYFTDDGATREITDIGDTVPPSASLAAPIYYVYHPVTGEYLDIGDPLALPAHHTTLSPPVTNTNQVAVFDGTDWAITEDNRGEVWDTETRLATHHPALGPLPGNLTKIPRPDGFYTWDGAAWVIDYAAARAAKISQLRLACAAQITSGIDHNALGAMHRYPTTKDDQQFMTARFSKAQAIGIAGEPYKFMCADQAGNWLRRDHSASQIIDVALAMEAHITSTLNHFDSRVSTLSLAPDNLQQISAVNW